MSLTSTLVDLVRNHRCAHHPVFLHWADTAPNAATIGALFHQIQCFCAATRPGGRFPEALRANGLAEQGQLFDEIVASESGHGPELATMAAHIMNRAAGRVVCPDLVDTDGIERRLKVESDAVLGALPGYEKRTGLTIQARRAIAVFALRQRVDRVATLTSLGIAFALETISNRHLIPGEKHCLVDSGLYGADLDEVEMHYLKEHWGEVGAEQLHERNALTALESDLDQASFPCVSAGAHVFLDSLTALWDVLDSALLQSGFVEARAS